MEMEHEHSGMIDTVVNTACRSHCGGACLLRLHVKDGRVTAIETDAGQQPQYRACAKSRAYRQRLYHPERLLYPMRRTGRRGSGEFARISWDEALDTVAGEIKRVKKQHGPSAVLFLCSMGDLAWLHGPGLIEKLLCRDGGYSGVWGQMSGEAAWFSAQATYGGEGGASTRDDLVNSKLIILWALNPADSKGYGDLPWNLMRAKEAGAHIVCVDPMFTDSAAAFADRWIPIIPGTDAAMLVAMAYVTLTEDLHDKAFLGKHTIGLDKYAAYLTGAEDGIRKTPDWAAPITGVPAATIAALARQYAAMRPAALLDALAPGRTAYGEQYHRAGAVLAAMTGNIGVHGGHATSVGGSLPMLKLGAPVSERFSAVDNQVDSSAPLRKDSVFYLRRTREGSPAAANFYSGGPSSARVQRLRVPDAILGGRAGGYPADYKLLYLVNVNYVNQYPNINRTLKALQELEFIVVQEQFMTPTAKFADILLPTDTFLERNDVTNGAVAPYYGFMNEAVAPLGESRSQFEIAAALAKRLGHEDFSARSEEDWLREVIAGCPDVNSYDTFKREGSLKLPFPEPFVAFEKQVNDPGHNPFSTPSGKIEVYSQRIADMDNPLIPPVPKYIPAWEGRHDPLAEEYPLQLVTTHIKRRAHTQFDNVLWLMELYPQAAWVNAGDAAARGIRDGDRVMVFNARGRMTIVAKVTERIMPGVVNIPQGAWYDPDPEGVDRGGCPNVLTNDSSSPCGALCSNTSLVQVERA